MLTKACPDASASPSVQIPKPKKPLMPVGAHVHHNIALHAYLKKKKKFSGTLPSTNVHLKK